MKPFFCHKIGTLPKQGYPDSNFICSRNELPQQKCLVRYEDMIPFTISRRHNVAQTSGAAATTISARTDFLLAGQSHQKVLTTENPINHLLIRQ